MSQSLVPLKQKQHPVTNVPRFVSERPFFYLTSRKAALKLNISFAGLDEEGRPYLWNVRPNRDEHIGVPGAEAHEVWIRLIKPALDESRAGNGGELPSVIPLGTVRECLRIVGWTIGGWEQERLFRCIRQIGAAWCEADFWQPTIEKDERGKPVCVHIKGEFSRLTLYAVGNTHVTEEEVKSGKVNFDFDLEDIVYIQLHPLELKMQRDQRQQPLDNEYLFSVTPAARRWYELLQPLFFGVTNNHGPGYCEIRYSWYIERHHTLKRHTERRRVVEQMNELIRDHKGFDYVRDVQYVEVKGGGAETDFIIRYWPGEGAKESAWRIKSRLGARRRRLRQLELPLLPSAVDSAPTSQPAPKVEPPAGGDALVEQLRQFGVVEAKARELVKSHREAVEAQIAAYPYREEGKPRKNAAGWLIAAIEGNYTLPVAYLEAQEKKRQAATAKGHKSGAGSCRLCDSNGWRRISTPDHPNGAMKRCTHDPDTESKYHSA